MSKAKKISKLGTESVRLDSLRWHKNTKCFCDAEQANCFACMRVRSEYLELRKTFDNFYELCEIKIEKVYGFCKKAKGGVMSSKARQTSQGREKFS